MNKWQANRAGLLNYWYYDEAEFQFADGRLLLRGSNGSGKSVTMQSLVTVLLDGVTRATRLDSFGSRARRIEDYLLGESEISHTDERTGYLYLEYKKQETDEYFTTGIGLHARRGSGHVDFWGFTLKNGRRIGHGENALSLTRPGHDGATGRTVKIPLARRELIEAIGTDGQVVTRPAEYAALVNEAIYGFPDALQYQELMELLIQLRSPKLSRDFRPTVIYEILSNALPALGDDTLRPLSETLENMQETELALEQMRREQAAFQTLNDAYTRYNRNMLGAREAFFEQQETALKKAREERAAWAKEAAQAAKQRDEAAARQQELRTEAQTLTERKEALAHSEAYQAANEKAQREQEKKELLAAQARREQSYAKKRKRELSQQQEQDRAQTARDGAEKNAAAAQKTLAKEAQAAAFAPHAMLAAEFQIAREDAALERVWHEDITKWRAHLETARQALERYGEQQARQAALERELGEEMRALDTLRAEWQDAERAFETARKALVAAYYAWKKEHGGALPILEETALLGLLSDLYETATWPDVLERLSAARDAAEQKLFDREKPVKLERAELERALAETEELLQRLRAQKEAEPERSEKEAATRERLRSAGIPFVPFYEAAEFRPDVPQERRGRIESALRAAGVLDALILPSDESAAGLVETDCGRVLRAGEPVILGTTLADYLTAVPGGGIDAARISAVLSGIEITEDGLFPAPSKGRTVIDLEFASFAHGSVSGHAEEGAAQFIGRQARENLRQQQIAAAEETLRGQQARREALETQLMEIEQARVALKTAREAFPDSKACEAAHQAIGAKEHAIGEQQKRVEKKDAAKKAGLAALREQKEKIAALCAGDALTQESGAYQAAALALLRYQEALEALSRAQREYAHQELLRTKSEQELFLTRQEADELAGDIAAGKEQIAGVTARIDALALVLEKLDAAAVAREIETVSQRLLAIPKEERAMIQREEQGKNMLAQAEAAQEKLAAQETAYADLLREAGKLVEAEISYAFLKEEELKKAGREKLARPWKTPQAASKKGEAEDAAQSLTRLSLRLGKYYGEAQAVLRAYGLVQEQAEVPLAWPADALLEGAPLAAEWQRLRELAVREVIVAENAGQKQSSYAAAQTLDARVAEQNQLLTEEDEKLFREIIMNNIGATISQYIFDAERWVTQMNEILGKSETSSGLKFRLDWHPAETGADTREIVRLLHADAQSLTEEDREKLRKFFMARIDSAKEEAAADEASADAFGSAVRQKLDYRAWYEFQLYYDKGENIKRRMLTDAKFQQLSGGEKAMAMYAPLFAAAYARYQTASPEAPYLITLDEAFAGVDEQNMRDMFRLVESLGFNYIMNSQIVWGEYDVVPSLNIYQIIRPQSAPYVTLAAYHWDGHMRDELK